MDRVHFGHIEIVAVIGHESEGTLTAEGENFVQEGVFNSWVQKSLCSCQVDLLKTVVEEGEGLVQEIVHSFVLIAPPWKRGYGVVHGDVVLNCSQVKEAEVNSQVEVIVVGLEKLEGGKFPYFVGLSFEEG